MKSDIVIPRACVTRARPPLKTLEDGETCASPFFPPNPTFAALREMNLKRGRAATMTRAERERERY